MHAVARRRGEWHPEAMKNNINIRHVLLDMLRLHPSKNDMFANILVIHMGHIWGSFLGFTQYFLGRQWYHMCWLTVHAIVVSVIWCHMISCQRIDCPSLELSAADVGIELVWWSKSNLWTSSRRNPQTILSDWGISILYTEIHMLVCILLDVRSSGIPTQIDAEYIPGITCREELLENVYVNDIWIYILKIYTLVLVLSRNTLVYTPDQLWYIFWIKDIQQFLGVTYIRPLLTPIEHPSSLLCQDEWLMAQCHVEAASSRTSGGKRIQWCLRP